VSEPRARRLAAFISLLPQRLQTELVPRLAVATRRTMGIKVTVKVSDELDIPLAELFNSARRALREGVDQKVASLCGRAATVRANGAAVRVFVAATDADRARPFWPLSLLTDNNRARIEAFGKVAALLHDALSEVDKWRLLLRKRAPSNDELLELIELVDNAPVTILDRLRTRVAARRLDIEDLVPTAPAYYSAVLGGCQETPTIELYLEKCWPVIQQRLLSKYPVAGTRLLLPLCIDSAFYLPRLPVPAPEARTSFFSELGLPYDLGSRLGTIHLAWNSATSETDLLQLNALMPDAADAKSALEARLLLTLAGLTYARLLESPDFIDAPDYWRRLCAWWNAGHVTQILLAGRIDTPKVLDWLSDSYHSNYATHSLLRLARAPRSTWTEPDGFAVEPFLWGRILSVITARPRDVDGARQLAERSAARLQRLVQKGYACEPFMTGPIVFGGPYAVAPLHEASPGECAELEADLARDDPLQWRRLWYLHQCVVLPQRVRVALSHSIRRSNVPESQESRAEYFEALLEAALLAAEFHDSDVVKAILERCRALLAPCSSAIEARQLAVAGLFAAAAQPTDNAFVCEYGAFLHEAALTLNDYHALVELGEFVVLLTRLLPVRLRQFSEARALLSLTAGTRW
jgi:hypothetical protein